MTFIRRYIAHDDPLVATCNLIALILAYNAPLYPVYLRWTTGQGSLPWSLLTLCSCPFFLAIPAISRRSALAARVLLPILGALNTIFCTWLLGTATGTELFFIPCLVLAGLLFRPDERLAMGCAAALPVLAFFLSSYGASPITYTATQAHAVLRLNAGSAGTLGFFIAYLFAKMLPTPTKAPPSPHDRETARSSSPHP